VPYVDIEIPASAKIGQVVDAKIGRASMQATLLSDTLVRIEPSAIVRAITSATTQDATTILCAVGSLPA
jgi:hypothetical protein